MRTQRETDWMTDGKPDAYIALAKAGATKMIDFKLAANKYKSISTQLATSYQIHLINLQRVLKIPC